MRKGLEVKGLGSRCFYCEELWVESIALRFEVWGLGVQGFFLGCTNDMVSSSTGFGWNLVLGLPNPTPNKI